MRLRVSFGELVKQDRRINERMGLLIGESGVGKTTAVSNLVAQTNAIYLESSANWTANSMLGDLCFELGLPLQGRARNMERQVIEKLQLTGRALFIDETNRIFEVMDSRSAMRILETLRKIHDAAKIPVWLVGLETLSHLLAHPKHVQLHSRIARKVKFVPCNLADARIVADTLCEVTIAQDLLADIHSKSDGSMRRLVVELEQAESIAKRLGRTTIALDVYEQAQEQAREQEVIRERDGVVDLQGYRQRGGV